LSASGPDRWACLAICTAGSRSRSLSATRARPTRAGWGEARLAGFLSRERYSGRQKPDKLLAKLRRAPEGRVGGLELNTRRQLVLTLVATIKSLNIQIKELERQIAIAIREHPDGQVFRLLFKGPDSVITAAELLSEIGDCRASRLMATGSIGAPASQCSSGALPLLLGSTSLKSVSLSLPRGGRQRHCPRRIRPHAVIGRRPISICSSAGRMALAA
jgi:hypothetical protein